MSNPAPSNARFLSLGLFVLCALVAVLLLLKFLYFLASMAVIVVIVLGLYEVYRFLEISRGRSTPPSSMGAIRGAGRLMWRGARTAPTVVRWAGSAAHLGAHATQEIAIGTVFGGVAGLLLGFHFGSPLLGGLLGTIAGAIVGAAIGRRRMRKSSMLPPVSPAARSRSPES